ncbi:unnamed protein product, partial [Didymodactylos carnosus]
LAAFCWTFHYAKRILETLTFDRFSHNTMPLFNLFKNCGYYWGFTAWVAYFVNHPNYTPASFGNVQIYLLLAAFIINEIGTLSIHLALRDLGILRPPYPTSNPFTKLFNFVSCPNYTYEMGSWISFSLMTQTLPGLLFTMAGAYQITMWALEEHRQYKADFVNYPRRHLYFNMKEFIVVLYAGGVDSRMSEVTSIVPKCLLPIGNRPLIWYTLKLLEINGCQQCLILTSPQYLTSLDDYLSSITLTLKYELLY